MLTVTYRYPKEFCLAADLDGLISLTRHGFHLCTNGSFKTADDGYREISLDEVRRQWTDLLQMETCRQWTYKQQNRVWWTYYIVANPGPRSQTSGLAAVVTPRWHFKGKGDGISWHLSLGLCWRDSAALLPAESLRLIELAQEVAYA